MNDKKKKGIISRLKGTIKTLWEPVCAVYAHMFSLILWFLFSIVAGLMGPIINIIKYMYLDSGDHPIFKAIYHDSINGSFYTFAIVLSASLLGGLLMKWKSNYEQNFRRIKVFSASCAIFLVMLGSVCYSFASLKLDSKKPTFSGDSICVDVPQLIFFVLAIILAIYCQGINMMDKNPEKHSGANEDEAIMANRENGLQETVKNLRTSNVWKGATL